MRYDEDGIRDYKRKIDLINTIPSNKIDSPNLNNLTKDQMEEFEVRHLRELAEQTRRYDISEQEVVAQNLDPFILYNALGEWLTQARTMMERGALIFTGGADGNDGDI